MMAGMTVKRKRSALIRKLIAPLVLCSPCFHCDINSSSSSYLKSAEGKYTAKLYQRFRLVAGGNDTSARVPLLFKGSVSLNSKRPDLLPLKTGLVATVKACDVSNCGFKPANGVAPSKDSWYKMFALTAAAEMFAERLSSVE